MLCLYRRPDCGRGDPSGASEEARPITAPAPSIQVQTCDECEQTGGRKPARPDWEQEQKKKQTEHKDILAQVVTKDEVPSSKGTPQSGQTRRIVLSCAWKDSLLEREFVRKGWEVIVITEEDDITTERGRNKAIQALKGPQDAIWHSQPCTGGCPWQRINIKKGAEARNKS